MDDIISFGKTKASRMEEEDSEGPSNADSLPECMLRRYIIRALLTSHYLDPNALLLTPRNQFEVDASLRRKIIKYLATSFNADVKDIKLLVPASLRQWGRVLIKGGGDLIHARACHTLRPDGRDASFVRVCSFII